MNKIIQFTLPFILTFLFLGLFFQLFGASQNALAVANLDQKTAGDLYVIKKTGDIKSTLIVNTLADEMNIDGDCSLREAVEAANTNVPVDACGSGDALTDTITFDVAGTIVITNQLIVIDGGPLEIAGTGVITTSGAGTTRVWQVETGSYLTLSGMHIINGMVGAGSMGAGLNNYGGSVTIIDSIFSNNRAGFGGGGVNSSGSLTIKGSTFLGNQADKAGGGIVYSGSLTISDSIFAENTSLNFGAIIGSGNMYLSNSAINNNHADDSMGGIANIGVMTITNSIFSGNSAANSVGAVYNQGVGTITKSTISGNTESSDGSIYNVGTLSIDDTQISGNSSVDCSGIFNIGTITLTLSTVANNTSTNARGGVCNNGSMIIDKSIFSHNSASIGGGICNDSFLRITDSTFSGNHADGFGGGIYSISDTFITGTIFISNTANLGGGIFSNEYLVVNNSTFLGNQSNGGGGIFGWPHSTTVISNSTFAENTAIDDGGAVSSMCALVIDDSTISGNTAGHAGGGIYRQNDAPYPWCYIAITNSTISENRAAFGGGIHGYVGKIYITNSIVANNPLGGDCSGLILDGGHNLDSDGTCGFDPVNGSLPNTDPHLGVLQDNGGPTRTHSLLWDSPAIDSGDDGTCLATDQRGVPRPLDGNGDGKAVCDMGAYERVYQPVAPLLVSISGPNTGLVGQENLFIATVVPVSTTIPLTYTWQASNQLPITNSTGLTSTVSFTWDTAGEEIITVTASNLLGSVINLYEISITDEPISGLVANNDSPTQLGETTTFTAVITSGTNVFFEWDFGDGLGGNGEIVTHTYSDIGFYTASVTATNSINSSSDSTPVNIYPVVHRIFLPLVSKSRSEIPTRTLQYPAVRSGEWLNLIADRAINIRRR